MKIKKLFIAGLSSILLIGATSAFAAENIKKPAEVYADLNGITVEEAIDARNESEKPFCQLANEDGNLEEFQEAMIENKKAIIEKKVEDGLLTREKADEIIKLLEEQPCDGTGTKKLGRKYGIGFGKGQNKEGFGNRAGKGLGRGMGRGCLGQGQESNSQEIN